MKLYTRIIEHDWKIADKEEITLRQRYSRKVKHLRYLQRLRKSKRDFKKAIRAEKKLKTIAGRLVRELFRKLPQARFDLYPPTEAEAIARRVVPMIRKEAVDPKASRVHFLRRTEAIQPA